MTEHIESVEFEGRQFALIVRRRFAAEGVHFFTPGEYSQQLAYMAHPKGKLIAPHLHAHVRREVSLTQEVLLIREGRLRVDFYGEDRRYLDSRVLEAGDVILLSAGGHGFEVLDDIVMYEVKQGPYAGDQDKVRFDPVGEAGPRG